MRISEYIEESIQDLIQARTYISTNTVPVSRRAEREGSKADQFCEIESESEERLSQNHDKYNIELSIRAVTKIQEDTTGASLDALWADLSDFATQDLTASGLQTAINAVDASSGIVVDGLDNMPGDYQTLEQYEYREQRIIIHFTFTN